jgi:hypothetical protein
MGWEDWYDYKNDSDKEIEKPERSYNKFCLHVWKPILLLTSTVFNCEKCGIKKEDYEKIGSNKRNMGNT